MPNSNAFALALKRRWWLVLLVLAVSLVSSAILTRRERPLYRTSTMAIVIPNTTIDGAQDVMRSLETLERRSVIATFSKIPSVSSMREQAAQELGVEVKLLSPYRVASAVVPNTNIIKVEVEGPDPKLAADYANALSLVSWREARQLYRIFSIKDLVAATPPAQPFYPDPQRNQVVAAILGLLLGVFAAFAADRVLEPRAA